MVTLVTKAVTKVYRHSLKASVNIIQLQQNLAHVDKLYKLTQISFTNPTAPTNAQLYCCVLRCDMAAILFYYFYYLVK